VAFVARLIRVDVEVFGEEEEAGGVLQEDHQLNPTPTPKILSLSWHKLCVVYRKTSE